MVWWCGCCRRPGETGVDPGAKLIVEYARNPRAFAVPPGLVYLTPPSDRPRQYLGSARRRANWFPVWMRVKGE